MQRRADCTACSARGVFSGIGADESAALHAGTVRLAFDRGKPLFHAGTQASGLYCIGSGYVKIIKYSPSGGQRIVSIVGRGGLVGMEAQLYATFDHTAIAMEPVTACHIPLPYYRRAMETQPRLQRRLLNHLYDRLRESEAWLSDLSGSEIELQKRLARLLLRFRVDGSDVVPCFNLEDIGAILGITMETACRHLARLWRAGLLKKHGSGLSDRYYKADVAGLAKVAEGAEPERQMRSAA